VNALAKEQRKEIPPNFGKYSRKKEKKVREVGQAISTWETCRGQKEGKKTIREKRF